MDGKQRWLSIHQYQDDLTRGPIQSDPVPHSLGTAHGRSAVGSGCGICRQGEPALQSAGVRSAGYLPSDAVSERAEVVQRLVYRGSDVCLSGSDTISHRQDLRYR